MIKLTKIMLLVAAFSVFVLTSVAMAATTYYYDTTLPTVGHKTVVEGKKENTINYATNSMGNCESAYYGWIDYKHDNSWIDCTEDYTCYANSTVLIYYSDAIPNVGTTVRLRTKAYSLLGGQRIVGRITF